MAALWRYDVACVMAWRRGCNGRRNGYWLMAIGVIYWRPCVNGGNVVARLAANLAIGVNVAGVAAVAAMAALFGAASAAWRIGELSILVAAVGCWLCGVCVSIWPMAMAIVA